MSQTSEAPVAMPDGPATSSIGGKHEDPWPTTASGSQQQGRSGQISGSLDSNPIASTQTLPTTPGQIAVHVLDMTVLACFHGRTDHKKSCCHFIATAYGAKTAAVFESWTECTVGQQRRKVLGDCVPEIYEDLASLEDLKGGAAKAIAQVITKRVQSYIPHEIPDVMNVVYGVSHAQARETLEGWLKDAESEIETALLGQLYSAPPNASLR